MSSNNDDKLLSKEEHLSNYIKTFVAIEDAMEPFKEQRKDLRESYDENGWLSNEKMSIDQAISSITEWSAYSMFAENFYGSIEKDYLADFTVLNKNLSLIDPADIPEVKVLYTFVDGKIVYQNDK